MRRNTEILDRYPDVRDFLKAAASETRQRILFLFVDGKPRTVGEIAEQLEIVPSTASEHLAILKRGGILDSTRDGKEVYYCPCRTKMRELLKKFSDLLTNCCPEKKE
jgi:DNA-binding transcriptional ArsR family regulator